jgi:hypothetical protein
MYLVSHLATPELGVVLLGDAGQYLFSLCYSMALSAESVIE